MKLCVVGTGYVGLVGAAVFADWGNEVVGVDIDKEKISSIKKGKMPIYELGLKELVLENIENKRLCFTASLVRGMKKAEAIFICVGTPQDETGAADLSAVWKVAESIGKNLKEYKIIVVKSTVPVGTNEKVRAIIADNLKAKVSFDVVSNPEFLREGTSVEDMQSPDRTVLGSDSKKALKKMRALYEHLGAPIVECDLRSSEMIKYVSNAFLATKISFINEVAQLCDRAGADVSVVAEGMGLDDRIGSRFLNAGIGYGGSCFPKDVAALYRTSTNQAYDFKLLRGVMEVNERQREHFVRNIAREFGSTLSGRTFACLGLAFKGNTDDVRESVAIMIVQLLRGKGARLRVYDPQAMDNAQKILGSDQIYYAKNTYDAIKGADALCLLTEWDEFRKLDLMRVKKTLEGNHIFDGRNLLDMKAVKKSGFTYYSVGRGPLGIAEKVGYISSAILNGRDS